MGVHRGGGEPLKICTPHTRDLCVNLVSTFTINRDMQEQSPLTCFALIFVRFRTMEYKRGEHRFVNVCVRYEGTKC